MSPPRRPREVARGLHEEQDNLKASGSKVIGHGAQQIGTVLKGLSIAGDVVVPMMDNVRRTERSQTAGRNGHRRTCLETSSCYH